MASADASDLSRDEDDPPLCPALVAVNFVLSDEDVVVEISYVPDEAALLGGRRSTFRFGTDAQQLRELATAFLSAAEQHEHRHGAPPVPPQPC